MDWVGDALSFLFRWKMMIMSVSDSYTLSRSLEERRSLSGSLSLVGCTCALFPSLALKTITNQRRRDPPRSVASFNPVSAIKPTVAWNLFAFLNASITIPTSRLLNCASIPSNAVWALNQKLISCDGVPEGTPLMSLVAAWMSSIHELTCEWRESWNALSVRCFDGR